jgi:hypothetical protein
VSRAVRLARVTVRVDIRARLRVRVRVRATVRARVRVRAGVRVRDRDRGQWSGEGWGLGLREQAERRAVRREGLRCEEAAAVAQELAARRAVLRESVRRHKLHEVGVARRRSQPLPRTVMWESAERVQREQVADRVIEM